MDIRGFGSFRVQERAARNARNLATGEIMRVAAKKVPVFKPSGNSKTVYLPAAVNDADLCGVWGATH